jgi:UDP-2-acetamido-2,6-beta-L-arabino-hexul-4-ose reductase
MHVVITGADGFIGRNLRVRLAESAGHEVTNVTRASPPGALAEAVRSADLVFHLAGVNRPPDPADFEAGNAGYTAELCRMLATAGRRATCVLASSTQATLDNQYGRSKKAAEDAVLEYARSTGATAHLWRLTNVFGKWSRPNYNSAVATFCHNTARGLPVVIHDPHAPLRLVYVDDVVDAFVGLLEPGCEGGLHEVSPVYETTVGEVHRMIAGFAASRASLVTDRVGTGLARALHATYLSFLEPEAFAYDVPVHADQRGGFVEMLKTPDCGQVSYFTAHPGVTRGGHYHHTKTEKFLVVKGIARFGFRHVVTGERADITVHGGSGRIVETVPGWAHDVTNVGPDEMVCLLWANENFDRAKPDTIMMKVDA